MPSVNNDYNMCLREQGRDINVYEDKFIKDFKEI